MTWPFPAADSDARHIDRALDDLATGDPYDPSYELPLTLEHVAVIAATQASARSAGSYPADAARLPSHSSKALGGVAGLSDL